LRAGADVLLLFTYDGSREPVVIRGGIIPPHETWGTGHFAFAISLDSLATWRSHLRESGIVIESEVKWERGGTSLYFRDPDANLVELATPGVWPNIDAANRLDLTATRATRSAGFLIGFQ
jgi:catechol 2,3-dioxygenase-like lactoylglutathione lyase family enzyme